MRRSRRLFAKIGCGLKRFLLANSMVHPTELIHEGIERTEEGSSSSLRAGREIQQDSRKGEGTKWGRESREKRVLSSTRTLRAANLHLNSFSWIRDVWKRVSRFASEEKNQTIPSYFSSFERRFFTNSMIINQLSIPKKNYHDYRYDATSNEIPLTFIIDTY